MKPEVSAAIAAAVFAGFSLVVSIVAIIVSFIQFNKHTHLEREMKASDNALTERLNNEETTEERRRFFVNLWDKMKDVQEIDVNAPAAAAVINALNTLELIALCWQANIVEKRMVFLAFGKMYDSLYTQLTQLHNEVPFLKKTGPDLLRDSPAISVVYKDIKELLDNQGQI